MTLLQLGRAARRRWLLVLVAVVLTELATVALTQGQAGWESAQYVSTGKLLLRPSNNTASVTALGERIEVSPSRSRATELWFLDFRHARQILESPQFLERVRRGLVGKMPDLTLDELRTRLLIYPSSLELQRLSQFHEVAQTEGEQELEEELEEQGVADVHTRRRLRMITLSASSNTPRSAEVLANVALFEFMAEARRRASRDYSTRREVLEELLKAAQANAQQANRALAPYMAVDDWGMSSALQRTLSSKSAVAGRIEARRATLAALERRIAEPAPDAVFVEDPEVRRQEQQFNRDQAIFLPDSPLLQLSRARLEAVRGVRAARYRAVLEEDLARQRVELEADLGILRALTEDVEDLRARLGSTAQHKQASRLRYDVAHWEQASLALVRQVYKARVEERQAEANGTLLVMYRPGLGTRAAQEATAGRWAAALVAMLPVGLFAGVVLAGGVDHLWRHRSPVRRIPRELGVPLLVTVPTFSAHRSKEWQAMKKQQGT